MSTQNQFLYPRSRYYGRFTPEHFVFNANLQEFSQRVSYLAGLESGGKISPEDSLCQIENLWQQLQRSKQELGIGE